MHTPNQGVASPQFEPGGATVVRTPGAPARLERGSMSSTRSKDRELIATTSSLVEFLRDVALARRQRIVDVKDYERVLWLNDLPSEVSPEIDAGPGDTLFSIPRMRPEAPPEPPAVLTGCLDR